MSTFWSGTLVFTVFLMFIYGFYRLAKYMDKQVMTRNYSDYKNYYSVPMKPDEILKVLSISARWDDWKSEYLPNENLLIFHHQSGIGGRIRFYILITDMGNFSVLSAGMLSGAHRGLNLDLDGFFAHKLNAVPIPNAVMKPHP